jgi:UDP-glucose 4-epimerase
VSNAGSVVVTGAGGYLGGRVVTHLAAAGGRRVRAISRRPAPWLSVPADVLDLAAEEVGLTELVTGADAVVHLAGANEVMAAHDPDRALADTVAAARHVAEACADAGVGRLVYISTVHVYGRALAPGATVTEDELPAPLSTYAIARLAAEHIVTAALADAVVLRLTNGVGRPAAPEVERWSLVANDLCRQAATTGALRLRTDGMQWRDFVALDDVCRVVAAALDPLAVPVGTYNLGSGTPLTVRGLAELVQQAVESATGSRPPLSSAAPTGAPGPPYFVATDRLAALGLGAEVPIEDAIDETVRFCLYEGVAA